MASGKKYGDALQQLAASLNKLSHALQPYNANQDGEDWDIDEKDKRQRLSAFFCYFMDHEVKLNMTPKQRLKVLIDRWTQLPQEERTEYSKKMKRHHKQYSEKMYQHYLYTPPNAANIKQKSVRQDSESEEDDDESSMASYSSSDEEESEQEEVEHNAATSEESDGDQSTSDEESEEEKEEEEEEKMEQIGNKMNLEEEEEEEKSVGDQSSSESESEEEEEDKVQGEHNADIDPVPAIEESDSDQSTSDEKSEKEQEEEEEEEKAQVENKMDIYPALTTEKSDSDKPTSESEEEKEKAQVENNTIEESESEIEIKEENGIKHTTANIEEPGNDSSDISNSDTSSSEDEDDEEGAQYMTGDANEEINILIDPQVDNNNEDGPLDNADNSSESDDDETDNDESNVIIQETLPHEAPDIMDISESSDDSLDATTANSSDYETAGEETKSKAAPKPNGILPTIIADESDDDSSSDSETDNDSDHVQPRQDALNDEHHWTGHQNGNAPLPKYDSDSDIEQEGSDSSIISLSRPQKRPDRSPQEQPTLKKRRYSKYQIDEDEQEAEFDRMADLLSTF